MMHVTAELIAFVATIFYYVAFALWKLAAQSMDTLRGTRPIHLIKIVVATPLWWLGMVITLTGAIVQGVAFTMLPLAKAAPIFTSSLAVLLLIAIIGFRERLVAREWLSLGLITAAMGLVALSVGRLPSGAATASTTTVLAVAAASVFVPILLFTVGDRGSGGRHARPIAGVAYGMAVGLVSGTSELMIKAISQHYEAHDALIDLARTPYPYALTTTAIVSWGMAQIGLQRSKLAVVISVGTIVAQMHLLITGAFLYGEPWPSAPAAAAARIAAFLLAVVAVLLFPRQETAHIEAVTPKTDGVPARTRPRDTYR